MKQDKFLEWFDTMKEIDKNIIRQKYMEFNYPIEYNILEYIKNHPNCNKEDVCKSMDENDICSRPITFRKIDVLVAEGRILNNKIRHAGSNRLMIYE